MDDLIEALNIFRDYLDVNPALNSKYPTSCEHDRLNVHSILLSDVTPEDQVRLQELGFDWDADEEVFFSYRFGSA